MVLEVAGDDSFGLVAGKDAKVSAACAEAPCHVKGAIRRGPPCVEFVVHEPDHDS